MNIIELSPAFKIGHNIIDKEYVKIVDILNRLHDLISCENRIISKDQWAYFVAKLEHHFALEENIKTTYAYPRIAIDRTISSRLVKNARKNAQKCQSQTDWQKCIVETIHSIISYILRYDLMFAQHLREIGFEQNSHVQCHAC